MLVGKTGYGPSCRQDENVAFVHVRSHPFTGFLWSIWVHSPFPQAIGKVRWINDAPS